MAIKAVFFDSGHTLMRPIGDRWFPGVRFFELCNQFGMSVDDDDALVRACDRGYVYLDAHHDRVPDEEAEVEQFREFYRLVFRELGVKPPPKLVSALAHAIVHEVNFEPYPGASELLRHIERRGLPMAVLTDAWPSVRTKFAQLGFLEYFASFVISAEVGCTKPDYGMFEPALSTIGVRPSDVLFVDDGADIVRGATDLGFQAHQINLEGKSGAPLTRLEDVRTLLD
jgi:putative hydrolase of the HAD superfamily